MRRLLHGDLVAAACVLLATRPERRRAMLRGMIRAADKAQRHVERTGRAHPRWGTGCLETVASAQPRMSEPWLDDPDYASCLIMVLKEVAQPRQREASARAAPVSRPTSEPTAMNRAPSFL
ncbi:MAG: hypothetical protein Q9M41_01390 [Paracoccaceae bacterium]|nr:hypothetical protein [Paracoccaceae bacterium]